MALEKKVEQAPISAIEVTPEKDISETVKDQTQIITQNISTFSNSLTEAKNYWDFERIKKEINDFLMATFENILRDKTPDFVLWFEQWNISKYQTKHDLDKVDLIKLLILKNKFYTETLRNIVSLGKLDLILSLNEKEDLLNMIDSWVFSFLDEIYLEWYIQIYNSKNEWLKSDKLVYWWVKDWKIVALRDLSKEEIKIDDEKLAKIHDFHIREYLLLFSKFIKDWVTDYDTWIDAEIHEVRSWQNRNNIFWLVAPMEEYMYPELLVEPELMIFLRNLEKKVNFEDFYWLSEEFFGDKYWMDNMTLDFVETLIQTWDSAFWWFIWKAFPNDIELSRKEWNCIILKDTNMKNVVNNARKWLKALLWEDFVINFDRLYNELIKEVTYHEFWHNLFVKWHWFSQLEEAKATLFYYLQVYKENLLNEYSQDDITRVIEFTIMDSIRNLERMNESSAKKYVILTKVNLAHLFASELVYWEDGKMVINPDKDKFYTFINWLKDMLYFIQNLYNLDDEKLKEEEVKVLEKIESHVWEHIEKMVWILVK